MSLTLGLSILYMPNKNKYQLDSGLDRAVRLDRQLVLLSSSPRSRAESNSVLQSQGGSIWAGTVLFHETFVSNLHYANNYATTGNAIYLFSGIYQLSIQAFDVSNVSHFD
jgi:hypothetical protein